MTIQYPVDKKMVGEAVPAGSFKRGAMMGPSGRHRLGQMGGNVQRAWAVTRGKRRFSTNGLCLRTSGVY